MATADFFWKPQGEGEYNVAYKNFSIKLIFETIFF